MEIATDPDYKFELAVQVKSQIENSGASLEVRGHLHLNFGLAYSNKNSSLHTRSCWRQSQTTNGASSETWPWPEPNSSWLLTALSVRKIMLLSC